jgi:hypothetical protein
MDTNPLVIVAVTFIILKLCNQLDWSWWGVTSPLWFPVAFFVIATAIALFVGSVISLFKH